LDSLYQHGARPQRLAAAHCMKGRSAMKSVLAAVVCLPAIFCLATSSATAATPYPFDGSWNIVFMTRKGACDASYNFTVNIFRGRVSHPNLRKFTGTVSGNGAVRASVSAGAKFASGSGRLTGNRGGGRWAGYSGNERCSGDWAASRN
jgi:hypothetical protein